MEETNKFNELKALKDQQNKLLINDVLHRQMAEERERKLKSANDRRTNETGQATFGPKETAETLMFQQLKRQSDIENLKRDLDNQIQNGANQGTAKFNKSIQMERHNVN